MSVSADTLRAPLANRGVLLERAGWLVAGLLALLAGFAASFIAI